MSIIVTGVFCGIAYLASEVLFADKGQKQTLDPDQDAGLTQCTICNGWKYFKGNCPDCKPPKYIVEDGITKRVKY